jgi:hypothetical protein
MIEAAEKAAKAWADTAAYLRTLLKKNTRVH